MKLKLNLNTKLNVNLDYTLTDFIKLSYMHICYHSNQFDGPKVIPSFFFFAIIYYLYKPWMDFENVNISIF